MDKLREKFNDKKYMAEYYRVDMSWEDFRKAHAARSEMLGHLSQRVVK